MPFRALSSTAGVGTSAAGALSGTTQNGDIQIAYIEATVSSTTITATPTGWTLIRGNAPSGFKTWSYLRVRQSGDSTTPTWTLSTSGGWTVDIWSGYGQAASNPVNAENGAVNTGASSLAVATTPTVADCMLVVFGGADTGTAGQGRTWTVSGSMTERVDASDDTVYRVVADEQLSGGSGVSQSRTVTITGGATPLSAHIVAIAMAPTSTTHQGAASFAGAGAMSTTGRTIGAGQAAFAGAGSLTAGARQTHQVSASFAGSGSMTSGSAADRPAQASFAGSGQMTTAGTRVHAAAASFTGSGALTATPGQLGQATFAGSGSMTATIRQTHQATVGFAGQGTLTSTAQSTQRVTAALAGAGQMTIAGTPVRPAQATLAGTGQMAVDGRRVHPATWTAAGTGALFADPTRIRPAAATFAGSGRMRVNARLDKAPVNISLWAVLSSGVLAPLPAVANLELSRERNGVGSVRVSYPAAGKGFAYLRAAVTDDRPIEVEMWLGGSRDGALRALLTQTEGDDLDGRAVWTFTGTFLETILDDGVVYPQPTPAEKGELRFDAKNAGQVILTVLQQAQARGALTGVTRDWTTSLDSSGQAWPNTITGLKYSPKTSLLAILDDLVDKDFLEYELTAARVLHLWAPDRRGTDRTAGAEPTLFRYGRVSASPLRHSTRDTVTAILAIGADGLSATASDAAAEARIGRRIEGTVDAGNLTDQGALTAYAQATLSALKNGLEEIRHPLTFGPGDPRPKAGYDLADKVLSERAGGTRRAVDVQQWTLTASRQRVTDGEVVLNDLIASRLQRLARQVQRLGSGGAVIGTSNPPEDRGLAPAAPTGVTVGSEAYQDAGTTQASLTVSWTPVTTNVDGTGTDDVAGYRVQWRLENAVGWQAGADTPSPPVSFGDVNAGADIRVRVAAYDRDGNQSAWSAEVSLTTEDDVTAPEIPATPVADPYLGQVRVAWSGLDRFGAPMALDTDRVELHASPASNFTPDASTAKDVFVPNIAGERVLTDLPYGVTIFVRLVAVDRSGNRSGPSTQGSATPSKVVNIDLGPEAVERLNIKALAVGTGQIDLLAVNDAQIGNASVGKLTTGSLSAIVTLSGEIRTATSGQRMRMGSDGIEGFLSDGVTKFFDLDIATQSVTVVGTYRSGFSGERINIEQDGSARFYGASGTDYGGFSNDGGIIRFRSRADGSSRRSFIDYDPTGLNGRYGTASVTYSSFNFGLTYGVIGAPAVGMRVFANFSPTDGTANRFFLVTSTNGLPSGDLGPSVIHYEARSSDNLAALYSPGRSGLLWAGGAIGVIGGSANSGNGPIVASAYNNPSSSITTKRDIRRAEFGAYDALDVLRGALPWLYRYGPGITDDDQIRLGPMVEDLAAFSEHLVHPNPTRPELMTTSLDKVLGLVYAGLVALSEEQERMKAGEPVLPRLPLGRLPGDRWSVAEDLLAAREHRRYLDEQSDDGDGDAN